jgi:glycosyltransferase involved in cell wall biosynthesis
MTVLPARPPRVSIHVPCHAEPPEIVIATLDRLAALEYPDFEVLVVDNNTLDPALWEPVRRHCLVLGNRFRFLHVEGITGAKAGALNWALSRTDPAAEIIAVVDADYQVEPEWLRHTVGYFTDPRMGFVQGPHAYRNYEHSAFGRWANWEYSVFFHAGMVSLNEHNAGLTVGTMSLIRRRVLEDVGGWAEWCLTEDSELAVRIHAAGYDSVYLTEQYGWGLIPQTFSAYRRQRFRWTYGPVQEFRHHWRLFLPRRFGGTPSQLTRAQKLHHANHGIDVICVSLRALTLPLAVGAATSMAVHHERIPVPGELWAASTSALIATFVIRYLVYSRVVGATIRQAVGGAIAFAALSLVIATGSLKASLGRPAMWRRTPKFRTVRTGLRVLGQVRAETAAAVACLLAAVLLVATTPLGGVVTMLAIGLAIKGIGYLAAVWVAITADRSLPSARPVRGAHRRRATTTAGTWTAAMGRARAGRAGLAALALGTGAAVVLLALSTALNSTGGQDPRGKQGGALGQPGQGASTDRPSANRSATGSPSPTASRIGGSEGRSAGVALRAGSTTPRSGTSSGAASTASSSSTPGSPVLTTSVPGSPSATPTSRASSVSPSRRPTAIPTPTTSHRP